MIFFSASITLIAITILHPIAVNFKLVDSPNIRKPHSGSIPLIGGIAMFTGVSFSLLMFLDYFDYIYYFLYTSIIIVIVGIVDDSKNISPFIRLLFQMIVGLIIVTIAGVNIDSLGNLFGKGQLILGPWTTIISVIAVIAAMNAVNMADGIHGLAGGNSLITFLSILILSINSQSESLILVILFCSVLPIFLIFNLCIGISSKRRIFMGDTGSMLIGLAIAWVLIDLSQGESKSFNPVTALWLFAVPLFEMTTSILRRIISGISPFKPDLYHSHHLLMKSGLSERKTLVLILLASSFTGILGIIGEVCKIDEKLMLMLFIILFLIYFLGSRKILSNINFDSII